MPVSVSTTDDGKKVTISVSGSFDFTVHKDFRDAFEKNGTPDSHYVIDLGEAEYMDSSALGMLLVLREHAGGEHADISITHCNHEVRELLGIANYQRLFKINETVA